MHCYFKPRSKSNDVEFKTFILPNNDDNLATDFQTIDEVRSVCSTENNDNFDISGTTDFLDNNADSTIEVRSKLLIKKY